MRKKERMTMRQDEIDEIWEIIRDCEEIKDGPMRYWNSAKMCQGEGDDDKASG